MRTPGVGRHDLRNPADARGHDRHARWQAPRWPHGLFSAVVRTNRSDAASPRPPPPSGAGRGTSSTPSSPSPRERDSYVPRFSAVAEHVEPEVVRVRRAAALPPPRRSKPFRSPSISPTAGADRPVWPGLVRRGGKRPSSTAFGTTRKRARGASRASAPRRRPSLTGSTMSERLKQAGRPGAGAASRPGFSGMKIVQCSVYTSGSAACVPGRARRGSGEGRARVQDVGTEPSRRSAGGAPRRCRPRRRHSSGGARGAGSGRERARSSSSSGAISYRPERPASRWRWTTATSHLVAAASACSRTRCRPLGTLPLASSL